MIVNSNKFQDILVSKRKSTIPEDLTICINDVDIKPKNSVKLLGITLDTETATFTSECHSQTTSFSEWIYIYIYIYIYTHCNFISRF